LFDYSHTAAPDYYSKHWHTIITLHCSAFSGTLVPDFVVSPGHYLERYLVDFKEIDILGRDDFSKAYRLYGQEGNDPIPYVSSQLIDFLINNKGFYLEVRDGVMLAFRQNQELANSDGVSQLFLLAKIFNNSCLEKLKLASDTSDAS